MNRTAHFAIALICGVMLASAGITDLPKRKIGAREFFCYTVGKNETVYGISRRLDVNASEIIRHNPGAADGVSNHDVLYFPVEEYGADETPVADIYIPPVPESCPEDSTADSSPDTIAAPVGSPRILLAMNLESNADERSRNARNALEFYRGFLIGADTLASRPGRVEIYLTENTPGEAEMAQSAVVIPSDDDNRLASLAQMSTVTDTYVLNLFNIRDSAWITSPYVIQANIPQTMMYRKAIDWFVRNYEGCTPVILRNRDGRNEKEAFINALTQRCQHEGIVVRTIEYDGALTGSLLESLPADADYVFVPSSGTAAEFLRFAPAYRSFRRLRYAAGDDDMLSAPRRTELFGFPDWVAFRGDAEASLYELEATVYSRFYDDYSSFDSRGVCEAYSRWYCGEPAEAVPSQMLMGFDAAMYVIKNVRANDGVFSPAYPREYRGVQSAFRLERVEGGGWVNTALYIVRFGNNLRTSATVI